MSLWKYKSIGRKSYYNINQQLLGVYITGYGYLGKLAESGLCIPIATVQGSFSAMNRIMTKLRKRMEHWNII